jgi:uncharacterized protein (TIGR00255 family)
MSLKSMTGFARAAGAHGPFRWAWEVKTVNAKGLDLRLRLPPGFDAVEPLARAVVSARIARGTCYAALAVQRDAAAPEVRVNRDVLGALIAALAAMPREPAVGPATLDGLLAVRGVVDVVEAADPEAVVSEAGKAALAGLEAALDQLVAMRGAEGAALEEILAARVETIARLTQAADDCPGRKPEAVLERLSQAVAALTDGTRQHDPARLHQEAILLAAKADVREELDRLKAHVAAARELLASPQPVGRRLDFLAQEFAREANTLCSKSNDAALTAIGMDLRVEIEQMREQVQNVE